jgi:acetylornithine aminotransferase/putrescine aminotransferase
VLRYVRENNLPERARTLGPVLAQGLREVLDSRGIVADVRGRGLLLAVDFSRPGHLPGYTAKAVVAAALETGLMLYPAGVTDVPQVVVVAPPLTVTAAELEHLLTLFANTLDSVADRAGQTARPKEGAVR